VLPVSAGSSAFVAFKRSVKISQGAKTDIITNLLYGLFSVDQQLTGFTDPNFIEKERKCFIRSGFKKSAKCGRCHYGYSGYFIQ
jgi:hypothetical protein